MAREKVTITVDRARVAEAQRLAGASTTSATIDLALRALIRAERLRRDVAAYEAMPSTEEEIALARLTPGDADIADDIDWEALYGDAER